MTDAISHRGPDGEGQWCEGSIGLGHRRLAIIDLSEAAAQPMHSQDGRYVIIYNGEVYNYRELRRELEKTGSRFFSQSDTEVVLEAIIRWGIDEAVRRFNGMFAFAIWDRQTQVLLLGRDRYGIKPLYLWHSRNQFAVASEPKAFRPIPGFVAAPDAYGIAEYFTFQNILSERTFTKDVSVFPAGHWAEISSLGGVLRQQQYWDFCFEEPSQPASEAEYVEELRRLLAQAVDRQLASDVEIGAFLSGGLDSGSIVSFAAKRLKHLKTFTVGFELDDVDACERGFDERAAAEEIATFAGCTQFETVIGARHVSDCLSRLVWHMEEPRVGQSYPNYYAAALASRFVKVVLAGTGGDEVLGGYPWRYPPVGQSSDTFPRWHFSLWNRLLSASELSEILLPLTDDLKEFDARAIHRRILDQGSSQQCSVEGTSLSKALYFEAKTFLPGLLAVEDRLSMAHGLEVRVPFLDNDLVDFSQSLPRSVRLCKPGSVLLATETAGHTYSGKGLLRHAMKDLLPAPTLARGKQGFSSPDSEWFRGDLRRVVSDITELLPSTIADSGAAARLLRHQPVGQNRGRLLNWSVICSALHLHQQSSNLEWRQVG